MRRDARRGILRTFALNGEQRVTCERAERGFHTLQGLLGFRTTGRQALAIFGAVMRCPFACCPTRCPIMAAIGLACRHLAVRLMGGMAVDG